MAPAASAGIPRRLLIVFQARPFLRSKEAVALKGSQRLQPFADRLGRLAVKQSVEDIAVAFPCAPAGAEPFSHLLPDGKGRVRHALKMHYQLKKSKA
jgi:hypothetical protein